MKEGPTSRVEGDQRTDPSEAGVRDRVERAEPNVLDRLERAPWIGILGIAVLVLGGVAGVALTRELPLPNVHDEFAYLLQAETFASGRLANPAHPLWQHFETFHVVQQPSYASKYQPAQGGILAIGTLLGHPIFGAWLAVALMAASVTWMLMQWVPTRWALLGGVLFGLKLGVAGYWGHSYWGGALAATGGALLFGAVRAFVETPKTTLAVVAAAGLVLLANTRPFEGFLLALAAAVILLVGTRRNGVPMQTVLRRGVVPVLVLGGLGAGWMAYYNWRVTGHALRLPHVHYAQSYMMAPEFFWAEPKPNPGYRNAEMERWQTEYALPRHYAMQDPVEFVKRSSRASLRYLIQFVGILALSLVFLRGALKDPWVAVALGVGGSLGFIVLFTPAHPHYLAPALGLLAVVIVASLRAGAIRGGRSSRFVQALIVLSIAGSIAAAVVPPVPNENTFQMQRRAILDQLEQSKGPHLVVVSYGPRHYVHHEWVYNAADIDAASIVWARDMGPEANLDLLSYYPGRRVWLLNEDDGATLAPYPRED